MSQDSTSQLSIKIFKESIEKYHLIDQVDQAFETPIRLIHWSIYSIEKIGSIRFNGTMKI